MSNLQKQLDVAVQRLKSAQTDLQDIEAKAASGGLPKSAVETVSAFANADGGLLILGPDEEKAFRPAEIDAAKIAQDLAAACADQLEPPIRAEIDIATVDDQPVVVATVDPLPPERKPCFMRSRGVERGSFIRTHDGDRVLTTYEVHILRSSHGQPQEDTGLVPDTSEADLDRDLVQQLLRRLRKTRSPVFEHASDDEILRMMRVVSDTDNGPTITLAGLVSLGRYPQQWLPQLNVTFVVYPTTTGEPLHDGTRFLDNQSIDGPVPVMVAGALSAVRRNMKRRAVVVGLGREDRWDYPEEAVREIIANALMHRDYHPLARGAQVRIELYPDRLVVSSPGGLFGPIAKEDLLAEPVSSSRNAILAKLLEDVEVPNTGRTVCENRGTGLLATAAALRIAGMEPPRLEDDIRTFKVVIENHGLLDEEAVAWLNTIDTSGLNDRQRLGLAFVRRHSTITNLQYRTLTGCDAASATRELSSIAAAGLIAKQNDRRWARWRLVDAEGNGDQEILPFGAEQGMSSRHSHRDGIRAHLSNGDQSSTELAASLGLSKQAVLRWLRQMETDGEVMATAKNRRSRSNKWRLVQ